MRKRKIQLYLLSSLIVVAAMIIAGELMLRFFSPTEYLYPRYKFSAEYGLVPFENSVMVHGVPGKFKFEYTVNRLGTRGAAVSVDNARGTPRIVVLGDSYAFGMGVRDGEEFASVLARTLGGYAEVVNLACPGWGLTQEIRRFYDAGLAYRPAAVILQFCANDPADNFVYRVTGVENGEFVFQDSRNKSGWVKRLLSKSFVQRSQLYNFFRARAYLLLEKRLVSASESRFEKSGKTAGAKRIPPQEAFYRELLELFAAKLKARNLPLIVIAVDHQLDQFPWIKETVMELDARDDITYLEVTDWLENIGKYQSVEGHVWGWRAHEVVGARLADYVRREVLKAATPADSTR